MKLKTSKSALKRFKFSSTGKISRRSVGINHFNAKDTGGERRRRRSEKPLTKTNLKDIKNLMPYNLTSF
ncbi:MAG: 50S ribosomal protein L35 [Patescibacteria group bacterium]